MGSVRDVPGKETQTYKTITNSKEKGTENTHPAHMQKKEKTGKHT